MSVIQLLVMNPECRPEMADISRVAASEEVPYRPDDIDLGGHTGFLPVLVGDLETGFEYYFDPVEGDQLPDGATKYGSYQMISVTGGDMAEMLASLLFFRTVARLSGAAYVYLDDDIVVTPEDVNAYLSDQIAEVRRFLR